MATKKQTAKPAPEAVLTLSPRATEKTYGEQTKRTYVFEIPAGTSKQAAAKLVEDQFKVTVTSVRVLTRKGKKTRFSRGKHAYPGTTYRQDKKFAYVTVKDGDKIKVEAFESLEEAPVEEPKTKKDAKSAKAAEKAEKSAKKAEKKGDK